ncbi:hypothetical protein HYS54_00210 [Candidatus Micrarchaeota archaeon]|nr:hypothetical protein [Candidatus Micrarchaeota archaeon]
MLAKERLGRLERVLGQLALEDRKIIVEGKHDRDALRELGVTNIVTIERVGTRIAETLDKDAIVLTDFDRKGRQLAERLRETLNGSGLNADMDYRREIKRYSGITAIEELPSRMEQIRKEIRER